MKRIGLRRKRAGRPSCPHCHCEIGIEERVRRCAICGTEHHLECARELTRCTLLGCAGKFPSLAPPTAAPPVRRSSWFGSGSTILPDFAFLWFLEFVVELIGAFFVAF